MKFLSLFSGIEAASVAWKPLGWECIGVAEIDPFPCAVLKHHYPDVPNLGSVTEITDDMIAALGPFDLVVGGSPCQDLSVAGKRAGLAGARSGLFHHQLRIFHAARHLCGARWLLWENVPGAFSTNGGRDFAVVVGDMAGLSLSVPDDGWGSEGVALGENGLVEWSVLDAQWFGVAQRRRRVFALLDTGDWANRPPFLLERESLRGDYPPSRKTREAVASGAREGAGGGRWWDGGDVAATITTKSDDQRMPDKANAQLVVDVCPTLRAGGNQTGGDRPPGTDVDTVESLIPSVAGTLMARTQSGGWSNSADHAAAGYMVPVSAYASVGHFGGLQQVEVSDPLRAKGGDSGNGGESLVAHAFDARQSDVIQYGDKSGPLDTDGHSIAVAFAQNQRDEVRTMDIAGALAADPGAKQQTYIAQPAEPYTLAIRGRGDARDLEYRQDGTANALLTPNGGRDGISVGAIAFQSVGNEIVAPPLTATNDPSRSPQSAEVTAQVAAVMEATAAVAFTVSDRSNGFAWEKDISPTLDTTAGRMSNQQYGVRSAMQVRRLTPVECERLQGFPDHYTAIPWRGKPADQCPDGPRYKALGNSMAVPVMRWIGQQIAKVSN